MYCSSMYYIARCSRTKSRVKAGKYIIKCERFTLVDRCLLEKHRFSINVFLFSGELTTLGTSKYYSRYSLCCLCCIFRKYYIECINFGKRYKAMCSMTSSDISFVFNGNI